MPREQHFITCGKNGCDGKVVFIAATAVRTGPQYDDTSSRHVFYECEKCRTIFDSIAGTDTAVRGECLSEYKGKLSRGQLIEYASTESGIWMPWMEDNILVRSDPMKFDKVMTVEETKDRYRQSVGSITLPQELIGCKVRIVVVELKA